jgi:hypothetical protein
MKKLLVVLMALSVTGLLAMKCGGSDAQAPAQAGGGEAGAAVAGAAGAAAVPVAGQGGG